MNELLGILWYMWLFLCLWLIPKIVITNAIYFAVRGKKYMLHYPFYIGSLALFAACILNHPYQ